MPFLLLAPAPAFAQTPVKVPAPEAIDRNPEEQLVLAARNLFDLIATPDPRYESFVHFTDKTRVWLVLSRGGLADAEMVEGQAARDFLTAMFGSEAGISPSFTPPQVKIDGTFGRAIVAIKVQEKTKAPECGTAYIDAVFVAPSDWAKVPSQGIWRFTQITLNFEKFGQCPG
ncbi:hypothetical protein [Sphingopyxis panaciterrae]